MASRRSGSAWTDPIRHARRSESTAAAGGAAPERHDTAGQTDVLDRFDAVSMAFEDSHGMRRVPWARQTASRMGAEGDEPSRSAPDGSRNVEADLRSSLKESRWQPEAEWRCGAGPWAARRVLDALRLPTGRPVVRDGDLAASDGRDAGLEPRLARSAGGGRCGSRGRPLARSPTVGSAQGYRFVVVSLASGKVQADQPILSITTGLRLGVRLATGASDAARSTRVSIPFSARLATVRCALRGGCHRSMTTSPPTHVTIAKRLSRAVGV